ncbi:Trm112 family protein [Acidobacteria bacterium AB60]|nr:Trm112 family protein [Acidobacteria bacterium AB60]
MAPDSPSDFSSTFNQLKEQLACPACHGELRLDPARLSCLQCGRAYPIRDGIPVLIAELQHPRD